MRAFSKGEGAAAVVSAATAGGSCAGGSCVASSSAAAGRIHPRASESTRIEGRKVGFTGGFPLSMRSQGRSLGEPKEVGMQDARHHSGSARPHQSADVKCLLLRDAHGVPQVLCHEGLASCISPEEHAV